MLAVAVARARAGSQYCDFLLDNIERFWGLHEITCVSLQDLVRERLSPVHHEADENPDGIPGGQPGRRHAGCCPGHSGKHAAWNH